MRSVGHGASESFVEGGYTWKRQTRGERVKCSVSIDDVKGIMENAMKGSDYNILYHNCHLAQQRTRDAMGLNVESPYDPRTLLKENFYMY